MTDSAPNLLEATERVGSITAGDLPDRLRRRYLAQREGHGTVGLYADATTAEPAFRDQGRRLVTARNDPNVVRDMVAVARHRGWATVEVRGGADFRRASWLAARRAGLEVRGYRPTERDRQELAHRLEPLPTRDPGRGPPAAGAEAARKAQAQAQAQAQARLRIAQAVVAERIAEPDIQARVLEAAQRRLAASLEQDRAGPARSRQR